MKTANTLRKRMGIIAGTAMLVIGATLPLAGTAQTDGMTESELIDEGRNIYENVCIACHQPDGMGIQGIYLPLNNNPLLTGEDPTYFIATVLNGRGGMPRFDTTYNDEEVAAIVSYVRQEWDNDAEPVSAEQVAEVRSQFEMTVPTPEGQIPQGPYSGTPDAGTPIVADDDDATPEGTPES